MDGRWLLDSEGGWTFFNDLSVSMLGEDARFAARECTEEASLVIVSFRILKSRIRHYCTLLFKRRSLRHCVLKLGCNFGGVM